MNEKKKNLFLISLLSCICIVHCHPPWKGNVIVQMSQSLASSGSFSKCWICHHSPTGSFVKYNDPIVVPITNFTTMLNFTVTHRKELSDHLPRSYLYPVFSCPLLLPDPTRNNPKGHWGGPHVTNLMLMAMILVKMSSQNITICKVSATYFSSPSSTLYLLTTCYNKADSKYNSPLCNGIRT